MSDTPPQLKSVEPQALYGAEAVTLLSGGVRLAALFVPAAGSPQGRPAPALIVSHGAGEYKENYLELARHLADKGVSSLLLDMHGHGASGGNAYHVEMADWVPDIQAAVDYLLTRPDVRPEGIGAFGLSSGGTAILEAAAMDSRLKALVVLDGTVMNTLPWSVTLTMRFLCAIGYIKRWLTGGDLRISIVKLLEEVQLAADPEINDRLKQNPGKIKAFANFPLPGASEAFFVDTIARVPRVQCPTLVIWGEEDNLDPVSTAHAIHNALGCSKGLEIVPGNGHAGHLDRHRHKVFDLTAEWILKHLS